MRVHGDVMSAYSVTSLSRQVFYEWGRRGGGGELSFSPRMGVFTTNQAVASGLNCISAYLYLSCCGSSLVGSRPLLGGLPLLGFIPYWEVILFYG